MVALWFNNPFAVDPGCSHLPPAGPETENTKVSRRENQKQVSVAESNILEEKKNIRFDKNP